MYRKPAPYLVLITLLAFLIVNTVQAAGHDLMCDDDFEKWPYFPEYTVLNPFPFKGANCTWYAHGRMMQLGFCKYALDTMRFNANTWASAADRGAVVTEVPTAPSIAYWDSRSFYGSIYGHVGVVEAIKPDGTLLISDSSLSGRPFKVYPISPGANLWPDAFIVVPEGPGRSSRFSAGQPVKTVVQNLNFRLEGANQSPILLPRGTVALIQDHPSNGIFASRPGSRTDYYHWWYAVAELGGEVKAGWLAETYLTEADMPGSAPVPGLPPKDGPPPGQKGSNSGEPKEGVAFDTDEKEETGPVVEGAPGQGDTAENNERDRAQSNPSSLRPGDVTGNDRVDVYDASLVMQHVLNLAVLQEDQLAAADVNTDGRIDILDVVLIMQSVVGLIELS